MDSPSENKDSSPKPNSSDGARRRMILIGSGVGLCLLLVAGLMKFRRGNTPSPVEGSAQESSVLKSEHSDAESAPSQREHSESVSQNESSPGVSAATPGAPGLPSVHASEKPVIGAATPQLAQSAPEKPAAPQCLSVSLALKNAKRNPNLSQHRVILEMPDELKDALQDSKRWCLTYGSKRLEARAKSGTQEWRVSLDPDLAADWNDDSSLQLHICTGSKCEASCPKEVIQFAELDANGAPADADSKEKELIAQWSALENEAHPPAQWKLARSPAGSVVSTTETCSTGRSVANK